MGSATEKASGPSLFSIAEMAPESESAVGRLRKFLFAIDADIPVLVFLVLVCFVVVDDVLVVSDANEQAAADRAARR
ncbi:unannotated protein [freshwater metagenome]|uniref:Unannotated protein n=1 Tax=freshwater metagenome TaxID=449393 RepID=A0A6J5YJ74_9ZZZZ